MDTTPSRGADSFDREQVAVRGEGRVNCRGGVLMPQEDGGHGRLRRFREPLAIPNPIAERLRAASNRRAASSVSPTRASNGGQVGWLTDARSGT